jgi:cytochrome b involved in lipid metabolism
MSAEKEFTYAEVAEHTSKKDIYIVVHDVVYDASNFVDEHPGGEEVLTDVAGQDATEAFEDVGHSDEAREILEGLKIGTLKRQPGDPVPKLTSTINSVTSGSSSGGAPGLGVGLYAIVLIGVVAAYGAWQYMQANAQSGK